MIEFFALLATIPFVKEFMGFAGFLLFCAAIILSLRLFAWVVGADE